MESGEWCGTERSGRYQGPGLMKNRAALSCSLSPIVWSWDARVLAWGLISIGGVLPFSLSLALAMSFLSGTGLANIF